MVDLKQFIKLLQTEEDIRYVCICNTVRYVCIFFDQPLLRSTLHVHFQPWLKFIPG